MSNKSPILEMRGICKEFPNTVANDGINLTVNKGEIHGLLGENGAGKSTLMRILYGIYSADDGRVIIDGKEIDISSPQDAIKNGIGMVHQHFMLIPRLTVAENVALGGKLEKDPNEDQQFSLLRRLFENWVLLDTSSHSRQLAATANEYGIDIDPEAKVADLDVGEKQRVEILKVLCMDIDILILDEPTAVLTPSEVDHLLDTLQSLSNDGVTIIFITHKLNEIQSIADRITVLRNGKRIDTLQTTSVSSSKIAEMMVGRRVMFDVEKPSTKRGEIILNVENLRVTDDQGLAAVDGVDLKVAEREIVGIAGVSGNGQKEIAEALTGTRKLETGKIQIDGKDLTSDSPQSFITSGVSYIPEDRHKEGCAPELSVMENLCIKSHRRSGFTRSGLLNHDTWKSHAEKLVNKYDIRGVSKVQETTAEQLSGGNLQKLIIARELSRDPRIVIANKPTRGVDVGAIESIRDTLLSQCAAGIGILLISEDLDELFDLSDRLLVIYNGEIRMRTTPQETSKEVVGLEMTGDQASSYKDSREVVE